MTDPRIEKLAEILVNYSVGVKPGDWVVIMAKVVSEPLILETAASVLRAGGNVTPILSSDTLTETMVRVSNPEQSQWVSPLEVLAVEKADAIISIEGTANTRNLSGIDSGKLRLRRAARNDLNQTLMDRNARGDLRWVSSLFPCQAFAQEADMSLHDYEDFVYSACLADRENPVTLWKQLHDRQERIVRWLEGKKQVTLSGPAVNLSLSIAGRSFVNEAGKENIPCGEIYTSPVENSANGWVEFTYPSIMSGHEVEGVRLEFKDGRVIKATARKNEAYLLSMLDTDEGARYLGEFAVGTNYGITRFTKNILFDEKIGGTFHLALGSGFSETGGCNRSGIHWDMICDMRTDSEIRVDDQLFYRNGEFQS